MDLRSLAYCDSFIRFFNTLDRKINYSATSNNIKLVHWPLCGQCAPDMLIIERLLDLTLLMGGLLRIFGTTRRGLGGAAARPGPSSLYQI